MRHHASAAAAAATGAAAAAAWHLLSLPMTGQQMHIILLFFVWCAPFGNLICRCKETYFNVQITIFELLCVIKIIKEF